MRTVVPGEAPSWHGGPTAVHSVASIAYEPPPLAHPHHQAAQPQRTVSQRRVTVVHIPYDDSHIARGIVNQRQERTVTAYRGALGYIGKRALGLSPELSHLSERLDATVEAIEHAAGTQVLRGGKLLGEARRRLDQVRERHMLPLVRLTRRLFAGDTRTQTALRVPHKRAATEELFVASAVIVKTLRPHRKFLAESHVDTHRIERLQEEMRRVKRLFDAANARTPQSTIATRRLPALFAEARADFVAIDSIVRGAFTSDELHEWRSVSRVPKRMGRPPKPKPKRRKKKGQRKKVIAKKRQSS